ncbi:hypothetical protein CNW10_1741 [Lactiplantibacillus plantarum]|nr:hypothetical protein LpDm1_1797 [Lactiplantibacillus plantarum]KZU15692.1 hypothetical protein CNW10_1741 [Lactiplantibacillus plantarum]
MTTRKHSDDYLYLVAMVETGNHNIICYLDSKLNLASPDI